MIDRNNPLPLTVINLERVWVISKVFEHDLGSIKPGDEVKITADANSDRAFLGRITYIGDQVGRAARALRTRIEVPNPEHLLKPGMFAKAAIGAGTSRPVLLAPESAIYQIDDHEVVFLAGGKNGFEVRAVQLDSRGDGTVEVLSGVSEGELVVEKGGLALKSLIANKAASLDADGAPHLRKCIARREWRNFRTTAARTDIFDYGRRRFHHFIRRLGPKWGSAGFGNQSGARGRQTYR
jgi:hypothetical protein